MSAARFCFSNYCSSLAVKWYIRTLPHRLQFFLATVAGIASFGDFVLIDCTLPIEPRLKPLTSLSPRQSIAH